VTDHAIATLVERRRVLMGEMHTLQTRLYTIQSDLAALDAVIKQLDPGYELSGLRPKYRRAPTPGEYAATSRSVLDVLRRATEPLSAAQVASLIMEERGIDPEMPGARRQMTKRVDMALRYQRTNGVVEEAPGEGRVMWKIEKT
jgi:hypothetical protein